MSEQSQQEVCPSLHPAKLPNTAAKSTKALTERLVLLVEGYVSKKEGRGRLENALNQLKCKRLRHPSSADTFMQHGGLESLFKLTRRLHLESEGDCKLATAIWGTIANLCALSKEAQLLVSEKHCVCTVVTDIFYRQSTVHYQIYVSCLIY